MTAAPADRRRPPGRGAKLRLAALIAALVAAFVVFAGLGVVSKDDVRAAIEPFGAAAPLAFVPISALLSTVLIPGAVLAAVSGLLFGPLVGTVVTIVSAVVGAMLQLTIAQRTGGRGMEEISGPRLKRIEESVARHGMLAVAAQRLMPGVPDAPLSYTFGLLGVRLRDIAIGTAIGSLPRAFAYSVLGSSYDDLSSPLAIAALVVLLVAGAAGIELGRRAIRHERRLRAAAPPQRLPRRDVPDQTSAA